MYKCQKMNTFHCVPGDRHFLLTDISVKYLLPFLTCEKTAVKPVLVP